MITIRHGIISDARAIAMIHVSSWQAIYRGHIPNNVLDNLSIDGREKLWKSLLENNVSVFVLEENKDLVGFISVCPSRDQDADSKIVAEISAIYVNPNRWRNGFGKLLCNTATKELKEKGYREVTLWVLDDNNQAKYFYETMGFINTADFKIDNEGGYTLREVRYRKSL